MLANIIFPAPSSAYLVSLFLPLSGLLALGSEWAIYALFSTRRPALLLVPTIGANVFSWVVGLLFSGLLPSGLVPRLIEPGVEIIDQGPDWLTYAYLSYPVACAVSIVLEFAVFFPLRRWLRIRHLAAAVVLANLTSYTLLGVTALVYPW
jgi:hypothetical protein